jgi:protein ImuB
LPRWPIERLRSVRPELKRQEIALYEADRRGLLRISVYSGRHGIRPGMPLAEAMSLARVHFEQHDRAADHAALLQLAGWCERFSPIVGIDPPDNLIFDATGLATLFGGEAALVEQISRAFQRYGLTTRIALADTIGAAWALAHFAEDGLVVAPPEAVQVRSAKCGVRSEIPSVTPHSALHTPHFSLFANLPLDALRLPPEMITILAELGINQIAQLLALPREALASRFDPLLLLRVNQALGEVPETIQSHRPPSDIVAETSIEFPTGRRAEIDYLLLALLENICLTLAERQQGVIQIECRLQCEANDEIRMTNNEAARTYSAKTGSKFIVGLYRPSVSPRHLLELARLQLDRLALPGPVAAIQLAVLTAAPLVAHQQDLFAESSAQENRRQLGVLVDRLSNRLGREAVVHALPLAEAQPEFAFRYEPLAGMLEQNSASSKSATRKRRSTSTRRKKSDPAPPLSSVEPKQRPLQLEHEPLPLEVLSVIPAGPPMQFTLHGTQHRVEHFWGPERIQTAWWRGQYIQRDYYRIETRAGLRFWLFRRLQDERWFLHGTFN